MKHYPLLSFILSISGLFLGFYNIGSLLSLSGIILALISLKAKPKNMELAVTSIILGSIGLFLHLYLPF